MRTFLLAATMLIPFAAFAGGADLSIVGDRNLAATKAGSTAGVQGTQGTRAQTNATGNGAVVVGAVSGNYTSVATTALGKAGPGGSYTDTTATQTNIGNTAATGLAINKDGKKMPIAMTNGRGQANGATGSASGGQNSQAAGSSGATASNTNVGGFVGVTLPRQGHQSPGVR
jgi:hypothetical protein